jgi:hypothetical protein
LKEKNVASLTLSLIVFPGESHFLGLHVISRKPHPAKAESVAVNKIGTEKPRRIEVIGVWKKLKQKMDERHIKRCPNIGHEKSKH